MSEEVEIAIPVERIKPRRRTSPSKAPVPKVMAGVAGSSVGVLFSVVLVWLLGEAGITMPVEVAAAVAGLINTGLGFLMAYITPPTGV